MPISQLRPLWAGGLALLTVIAWLGDLVVDIIHRYYGLNLQFIAYELGVGTVIAAGSISLRTMSQRGNGAIMLAISLTLTAGSLLGTFSDIGPASFILDLLDPINSALVAHLLVRWPRRRLQARGQRVLVAVGYTVLPFVWLLYDLAWNPSWGGYIGPAWWPTLFHSRPLAHRLAQLDAVTLAVLIGAFVGLIGQRLAKASRPERRELVPVAIASVLLAMSAADQVAAMTLDSADVPDPGLLQTLALLTVPVALLGALAARRIQRALAIEALVAPGRLTAPESVRDVLARAMGDKDLALAFYSNEHGGYLGSDSEPAPAVAESRFTLYVAGGDGAPLARLDLMGNLADRPELTSSVAHAAVEAMERARLRSELRARADEVTAVRRHLETAATESARLSRMLPTGLPQKLRADPSALGRVEDAVVTVLMSDVRGYSGIAEQSTPATLARQLNEHRAAMNSAILSQGGTVMQYVGDAVMAVFGAPFPQQDHAEKAIRAALAMHREQTIVNERWAVEGLDPFGLGIGLSTGPVATAILGSEERFEYTIVGDTVNLAQRLESLARPGGSTIASAATLVAARDLDLALSPLPGLSVKGRQALVDAYRIELSSIDSAGHPPSLQLDSP